MGSNFIQFINYRLYASDILKFDLDKSTVINTINPHSFCVAEKDKTFKESLENSDVLLPDGIGIVWATWFIHNKRIKRKPGFQVFQYLLAKLNAQTAQAKKVFFLGSTDDTLIKIRDKLKNEYPSLDIETFSPPFREVFSEEENTKILDLIKEFNPAILFVGMTAPRQEKWVYKNKDRIQAQVICSIGAVFDFYAGTVKRPSEFWIGFGLEWFARFVREPKRLWKRNLISTPHFVYKIVKYKLQTSGMLSDHHDK